ncbi:MAG: hypothetical protein HY287_13710 [Planctomycetes bacterium]|nr:hypothetical protein [Planctomycetota bacterium]MBI3835379.1 hypothetical protein [Planctomycetota bacterium]
MQIWAVAKHTIAEGVRMKIALVFLLFIGLVVLGLPFSISGDSTMTGAVQAFISYSLNATGLLLGMLTIFLSRSISDEFINHQIFLVVTKPIPRWQYVVGKWLGILLLTSMLLAAAGVSIRVMEYVIQRLYIRSHWVLDEKRSYKPKTPDQEFDASELRNEVLVSRHATPVKLPNFADDAELEYKKNLEEGRYANIPNLKPETEKQQLVTKYEARWRIVGPNEYRAFEFENILCDRSAGNEIQLRYKANVSGYPPDEVFRAMWRFGDPYKGTKVYEQPVRHIISRFHTIRVPADAVADDHTLLVTFYNSNPYPGEPQFPNVQEFRKSDGLEVLFVVGSFSGNLFRLIFLEFCKLSFLSALAVLMASLFSYPVACLCSFTSYIVAGAKGFFLEALNLSAESSTTLLSATKDLYGQIVRIFSGGADLNKLITAVKEFAIECIIAVLGIISLVLPDLSRFDAVEVLVTGRNVGLAWVLQGFGELVVLETFILLGIAIFFFYRREVAELSL